MKTKSKSVGKKKEIDACNLDGLGWHLFGCSHYDWMKAKPQPSIRKYCNREHDIDILCDNPDHPYSPPKPKEYDKGCPICGQRIDSPHYKCAEQRFNYENPPVSSKCEEQRFMSIDWSNEMVKKFNNWEPDKVKPSMCECSCSDCRIFSDKPHDLHIRCSPTEEKKDLEWEDDMEKSYYKEVDTLSDDTGYFDHDFVLKFFRKYIKSLLTKTKEDMIEEMEKEIVKLQDVFLKEGRKDYDDKIVKITIGVNYLVAKWWGKLKSKLLKKGRG